MIGVGARVIALEDVRLVLGGEAAQALHGRLRLLLGEPRVTAGGGVGLEPVDVLVVAEEAEQVVECVVDRGRVRLAAHEVLGLAHLEVQRRQGVHGARAGGGVSADLRIGGALVLPVVGHVDHGHGLDEGALSDPLLDGRGGLGLGRFGDHVRVASGT